MGFDDGQIYLDNANEFYFAGQTVHGRVVFDQTKPKTIHGICISFKGYCKVHWTTRRTRRRNNRTYTETVNHDSYEEFFLSETYVCGSPAGEHNLQPGHYEYNFDHTLPTTIPSSFEAHHGHIRYRVKVVMHTIGILTMNKTKKVPLKVIAPVNLNLNPYCREPIEMKLMNSYCCWCVSAGSSEIRVRLPMAGYCPGQTIPIEVNISNLSRVTIDEINFAIIRDVRFIATSAPGVRTETETVVELKEGPVEAGTVPNWNLQMLIPPVEAYNFDGCRYIDINYTFKVTAETSGCHEDGEDAQRILIGNIPLIGYQDNIPGARVYPGPVINPPQPYPYPQNPPQPYPYPQNPPQPFPYPQNPPQPYPYPQNPPHPNPGNGPYPYPENQPYPGNKPDPDAVPTDTKGDLPPPYPGFNPKEKESSGTKDTEDFDFIEGNTGASAPLLTPGAAIPSPANSAPIPYGNPSAPGPYGNASAPPS